MFMHLPHCSTHTRTCTHSHTHTFFWRLYEWGCINELICSQLKGPHSKLFYFFWIRYVFSVCSSFHSHHWQPPYTTHPPASTNTTHPFRHSPGAMMMIQDFACSSSSSIRDAILFKDVLIAVQKWTSIQMNAKHGWIAVTALCACVLLIS